MQIARVAFVVVVLARAAAWAQTPDHQAGGHVHYVAPPANQASPTGALAPRLQNLGPHTFPVSTRNRQAQLFINQGLNLAYAFNHAEARRAFREAARLDPNLAMAYWGQALVLGPNINAAMEPNEEPQALELVQKALSLKARATPREQAYIDALAQRYSGKADDRAARDRMYADAMRTVHRRFPQDLDAAMLYVESMMDLRPWGYWQGDGAPHQGTAEIVALTEQVIARNPRHPGALHMYIHLLEATSTPERAERAADTLLTLMPAAGHMVHMPGHIYQRVGRYADAIRSNELAIAADEDYIVQCRAQGSRPAPTARAPGRSRRRATWPRRSTMRRCRRRRSRRRSACRSITRSLASGAGTTCSRCRSRRRRARRCARRGTTPAGSRWPPATS
jgi:tetratricopeptide (TPR) repeat protein